MNGNSKRLGEITKLIETGIIKPVIDKVFPFEQTNEALDYVETGRSRGKVVIKVRLIHIMLAVTIDNALCGSVIL